MKSVKVQRIAKRLERNLNNQCYFCSHECMGARWVKEVNRWYNFCNDHHPPELWAQWNWDRMFMNDLKEFKWFVDHNLDVTANDRRLLDGQKF